jgi:SAM-dependent methyltransferase
VLQRTFYMPLRSAVLRAAVRHVPGAVRVLDVGCGTGQLLREAASLFATARLIGVDPAAEMLRRARGNVDSAVELVLGDVHRLPFPSGSFDLVLSTASGHHWSDPRTAFAEIARVLSPGGAFVLGQVIDVGTVLSLAGLSVAESSVRADCPVMPPAAVLVLRRAAGAAGAASSENGQWDLVLWDRAAARALPSTCAAVGAVFRIPPMA